MKSWLGWILDLSRHLMTTRLWSFIGFVREFSRRMDVLQEATQQYAYCDLHT